MQKLSRKNHDQGKCIKSLVNDFNFIRDTQRECEYIHTRGTKSSLNLDALDTAVNDTYKFTTESVSCFLRKIQDHIKKLEGIRAKLTVLIILLYLIYVNVCQYAVYNIPVNIKYMYLIHAIVQLFKYQFYFVLFKAVSSSGPQNLQFSSKVQYFTYDHYNIKLHKIS